jgi:hypothetical protein
MSSAEYHFPQSTLASTKSMRPKLFKRATAVSSGGSMDIFLGDSLYTLKKSAFNVIDEKCHLEKFERCKVTFCSVRLCVFNEFSR